MKGKQMPTQLQIFRLGDYLNIHELIVLLFAGKKKDSYFAKALSTVSQYETMKDMDQVTNEFNQ